MQVNTVSSCFWEGKQIRLRPFAPEDVEIMYAEERDSESIRIYEPGIHPIRARETLEKLVQSSGDTVRLAIEMLTGTLVGTSNLRDWDVRNGTFSFSVRIYRDHQRKGYATEAVKILLRYGFYELRCQKANSVTIDGNEGSVRLHHSLGFQEEGRLRRNCYTGGEYRDEILFGLTREEFAAIDQKQ